MRRVAGIAEMKPTRRPLLLTLTPQCHSLHHPGGCNALKIHKYFRNHLFCCLEILYVIIITISKI